MQDGNYKHVPGIPDITIASLVRELAKMKGNNITVILDACHSGGGTRDSDGVALVRCRTESDLDNLPFPDIDKDLWALDDVSLTGGADASHVLLAACRDNERAFDGYFTRLLVECLREKVSEDSTYADLRALLPYQDSQHPQCEGNEYRNLFSSRLIIREHRAFTLAKRSDGKFDAKAWDVHGVKLGTRFEVRDPVAWLRVERIEASSSILIPEDTSIDIPDKAVAWATLNLGVAVLKVYLHESLPFPPPETVDSCFTIVNDPDNAHIILSLDPGDHYKLRAESLDPLLRSLSAHIASLHWRDVRQVVEIPRVLDAIAHFRYHLGRHRGSNDLLTDLEMSQRITDAIFSEVTIELYRLRPRTSGGYEPETPKKNLLASGIARLPLDDSIYGVRLASVSQHKLFFYFFYFDPTEYSIQAWHLPSADNAPNSVTVGYGAGGGDPIAFALEDWKKSDAGFLKAFVSTEYVDMQSLPQSSPIDVFQTRIGIRTQNITGLWGAWLGAISVSRSS